MPSYPRNAVRDFLIKFPEGTYSDFAKQTGCGMSLSTFKYHRNNYRTSQIVIAKATQSTSSAKTVQQTNTSTQAKGVEKRPYSRRATSTVYETIWQHTTENIPKEAKDIIRNLVQQTNQSKRTNWEFIELSHPLQMEIREHVK
jgi:hypothetical protein